MTMNSVIPTDNTPKVVVFYSPRNVSWLFIDVNINVRGVNVNKIM